MTKFIADELGMARMMSYHWDEIYGTDNNRCIKATDWLLSRAYLWSVDVPAIIGALSTIGRVDIAAEVMDELRKRDISFDTEEEL